MKWITDSLRTLRKETNCKPSCGIGPARGHIQLLADIIIRKQPHMGKILRKQDSSFTELARETGEKTETEM